MAHVIDTTEYKEGMNEFQRERAKRHVQRGEEFYIGVCETREEKGSAISSRRVCAISAASVAQAMQCLTESVEASYGGDWHHTLTIEEEL
jgi:hypothetical protein